MVKSSNVPITTSSGTFIASERINLFQTPEVGEAQSLVSLIKATTLLHLETAFGTFNRSLSISVVTSDLFLGAVEAMEYGVTKEMLLSLVALLSQQNAHSSAQGETNGSASHP